MGGRHPRYKTHEWHHFLEIIAERCDNPTKTCQIPRAELARLTGFSERTLCRHIDDAKKFGIIHTQRVMSGFAIGHGPSRITLLVDPADWAGRWDEYLDPLARVPDVADPDMPAWVGPGAEQIDELVAAELEKLETDDVPVDAWLAGGD